MDGEMCQWVTGRMVDVCGVDLLTLWVVTSVNKDRSLKHVLSSCFLFSCCVALVHQGIYLQSSKVQRCYL